MNLIFYLNFQDPLMYLCTIVRSISIHKRIVVILIMIPIILQAFSQALILGDYYVHTAVYAALCINKDKIEMRCNGRCQMAQKMQQEADNHNTNPHTSPVVPVVYFVPGLASIEITAPMPATGKIKFPVVQETITSRHTGGIFRPPIPA